MRRLHYYGLWVLVEILLFYGCKQDATAWSDLIKDHAHTSELNASLQEAFSLRYQRNYPAAARAFETVLKDKTIGRSTQIDVLNQLGFIYLEMGDTTAAIPLLDKLAKQESDFNAFQRADYWYNLGVLNLQRIKPDEAKKNLEDALRMYISKYPRGHLRIAMAYTQAAMHQLDFGLNTKERNNIINAAFRSYYYANPKDSTLYPYADKVNYLMAQHYRMTKRDYQAGLNHCRLAEKLIQRFPFKDTTLWARCLVVKGMLLKKAARYPEADSTLNESLKLLIHQRKNSIFIQEVYRFLVVNAAGRSGSDIVQESKDEAEKLYAKYRVALRTHLEKTSQKEIYVLSDDLDAYYSFFRIDKKAEDCFKASKAVLKKINPQIPSYQYYRESAYGSLSRTALINKNYQQALDDQLEAFKTDINPSVSSKINSWTDAMNPKYYNLRTNSFSEFRSIGQIYLSKYKEENDVKDLAIALRLFEVSDSLMSLSLTMSEGGVLSYHQEIGNVAYGSALETTYLAFNRANQYPHLLNKDKILNLAFRFIERQKTYILTREDIPSKSLAKYYTIKIKQVAANIAKLGNGGSHKDSILSLVKANFEYDSLLNKLSQKATDRFNQNIPTVQNIQSGLKDDEVLLQYKVFDQLTYVFGLSSKAVFFDTVGATPRLRVLVTQFSKLVSSKIDHFDYEGMNKAKMVYDLLLKRVLAKSPAQKNLTLIIIPDRFLTDVPFDALPTCLDSTINDWIKVDYLLKKHYVVYAPSWKIWQTNRYLQLANSKYPAAFFSYTIQNNPASNLALAGAKIEKEALANFARTTPYTSYYCTSALFRKNATRFRILHFCLHGKSDLSKLDANELYFKITSDKMYDPLNGDQIANLNLKDKWAIISACETGIGQTNAEGTYSLSRAFLQAGCAFTISSLWKINNDTSSEILAGFYQNLQDEKKPWKALTKAKRDYIKSMDNQPPYYWSGLIPTI